MKKLLALMKTIIYFIAHPIVSIKNGFNGMIYRHYERASENMSDRTHVARIKENIAEAKFDMRRAQTAEDEKSRRYYADEAVKEIEEAIDDCKTLVNIDEAHHYFGIIGRPKIWKWAALPVIALVVLGVHVGDNLAAAFGCAYNVWVESLLAFAVMVAILIPAMFFVMRVLFQVLLLVRISSLEMLHGRIVGVKNNIYAEAEC